MLGLGDIVMPGLLLCFVLRFDAYKRSQLSQIVNQTTSPLLENNNNHLNMPKWNRLTYFHCSLIGYLVGLITATLSSEVFKAAQPALLYLVPFTLLPLLTMAYLKVCLFIFMN
jgi:signal peptide peptidase-like protein 3